MGVEGRPALVTAGPARGPQMDGTLAHQRPEAGQAHFTSPRLVPMLSATTGFTTTRKLIPEDLVTRRSGITERSHKQIQLKWRPSVTVICKEKGLFFRFYL